MSHHIIGFADTMRSLTTGAVPSMGSFSNMANSTDHKVSQPAMLPLIEDVPSTLLESFLPGFSVVRRFALLSFGFDITILVQAAFIIGVLLSSAGYVWSKIAEIWWNKFTADISISSQERVFEPAMRWLAANVIKDDAQRLTVSGKFNYYDEDDEDEFESGLPPLKYCPSYGDMSFWWQGRRFVLTREGKPSQSAYTSFESIRFCVSGRSSAPIKRLLEECQRFAREKQRFKTNIRCLDSYGNDWTRSFVRPSRPMNTVYMDPKIKATLLKDAEKFIRPETYRFYASRGIPYRRGYLFYGPPGTGKSSLSFALAGRLGYDLHYLSLNDKSLSDAKIRSLFNELPSRSIILLEDIDAVGLARKLDKKSKSPKSDTPLEPSAPKTEDAKEVVVAASAPSDDFEMSEDKVTLSGLLNAIDGVASSEGRILIMTSNDPEALDKALIRPGRVDRQIYFGYASKTHAEEMYMRFFPDENDDEEKDSENTDAADKTSDEKLLKIKRPTRDMAEKFASLIPVDLLTPAEIQGYLLIHAEDPQQALDGFSEWIETMKVSKQSGKNIIKPD